MEGLLERLAKLSLQKAGKLSKTAGEYGGAALGAMGGPMGAYAGQQAGKAIGGGVKGLLDTLAEDKRNPHGSFDINNLHSFQQSPSFGQRAGENIGGELIDQAGDIGKDYLKQFAPGQEQEDPIEKIHKLLEGLSPEQRAEILAKYAEGGQ